jgi:hypothetical protein
MEAVVGDLTIRGMDPKISELLSLEADREGKTPEQLALEIIADHVQASRSVLARKMDRLRETTTGRVTIDPVDLIRSDRDGDRGL